MYTFISHFFIRVPIQENIEFPHSEILTEIEKYNIGIHTEYYIIQTAIKSIYYNKHNIYNYKFQPIIYRGILSVVLL